MSDQRDLLERLRSAANSNELRHEAADEIARLRSICNGTVWEENECLQALLASANERVAEMQAEAGMYHSLYDVATERLASARKALGTIYVLADDTPANEGQLDRIQEIAKAALTDEKGN